MKRRIDYKFHRSFLYGDKMRDTSLQKTNCHFVTVNIQFKKIILYLRKNLIVNLYIFLYLIPVYNVRFIVNNYLTTFEFENMIKNYRRAITRFQIKYMIVKIEDHFYKLLEIYRSFSIAKMSINVQYNAGLRVKIKKIKFFNLYFWYIYNKINNLLKNLIGFVYYKSTCRTLLRNIITKAKVL